MKELRRLIAAGELAVAWERLRGLVADSDSYTGLRTLGRQAAALDGFDGSSERYAMGGKAKIH